jgi:hypothetical protein
MIVPSSGAELIGLARLAIMSCVALIFTAQSSLAFARQVHPSSDLIGHIFPEIGDVFLLRVRAVLIEFAERREPASGAVGLALEYAETLTEIFDCEILIPAPIVGQADAITDRKPRMIKRVAHRFGPYYVLQFEHGTPRRIAFKLSKQSHSLSHSHRAQVNLAPKGCSTVPSPASET